MTLIITDESKQRDPKQTHIDLIYYKYTGKYYCGGEVDIIPPCMFHEAVHHVQELLNGTNWPGLVEGTHDFDCLATIYTEYGPLTHLFVKAR